MASADELVIKLDAAVLQNVASLRARLAHALWENRRLRRELAQAWGMNCNVVYSQRNGETKTPTKEGWYWFTGILSWETPKRWHGLTFVSAEGKEKSVDPHTPYITLNEVALHKAKGCWWGPVTPPWEDAT